MALAAAAGAPACTGSAMSQGNSLCGLNTLAGLRRVPLPSHGEPQSLRKAQVLHAQKTLSKGLHLMPGFLFWFPVPSRGDGPWLLVSSDTLTIWVDAMVATRFFFRNAGHVPPLPGVFPADSPTGTAFIEDSCLAKAMATSLGHLPD